MASSISDEINWRKIYDHKLEIFFFVEVFSWLFLKIVKNFFIFTYYIHTILHVQRQKFVNEVPYTHFVLSYEKKYQVKRACSLSVFQIVYKTSWYVEGHLLSVQTSQTIIRGFIFEVFDTKIWKKTSRRNGRMKKNQQLFLNCSQDSDFSRQQWMH